MSVAAQEQMKHEMEALLGHGGVNRLMLNSNIQRLCRSSGVSSPFARAVTRYKTGFDSEKACISLSCTGLIRRERCDGH